MLQHATSQARSRVNGTTSSESNFASRWGKSTGLGKTIDRSAYELGPSPLKNATNDLNEKILMSYKSSSDADARTGFIERLCQESLSFLANQNGIQLKKMQRQSLYNQAVAHLVEHIFDVLQGYAFAINDSLGWNDLYITSTRPQFVTEVLHYSKTRQPLETVTNYRARLSTRYVSLVIRGRGKRIEVMLLPVDRVIGLSAAEGMYEPCALLEATAHEEAVSWDLRGADLTGARLEILCMELFATLLERTKEESSRSQCE